MVKRGGAWSHPGHGEHLERLDGAARRLVRVGYLRIHPDGNGSRVVVHQLVNRADQAEFMAGAGAMVLGRLRANIVAALAGSGPPQRPPGTKQSRSRRPE